MGEMKRHLENQGFFDYKDEHYKPIYENRIVRTKRFLNVKELAIFLNVSAKTIYGWVYRGIIEPERIGPRLIRFDVEKVERWISSLKGDPNGN